jgi:hypothetical protein
MLQPCPPRRRAGAFSLALLRVGLLLSAAPARGNCSRVTIVANRVQPGGQSVATVAQLQALLDTHPSTVFDVSRSRWTVSNQSIWLRSNRSLLMDSATVIEGTGLLPLTDAAHEGGGAVLTVTGSNISVAGGRIEQDILPACVQPKVQPTAGACNFGVDIYHSSAVTFRDTCPRPPGAVKRP